jgi:hypothetical protein
MSSSQRLVGTYLLGFEPILVSVVDGPVLVRFEGVPKELATGLVGSDMAKITSARSVPGGILVSLTWDDEVSRIWDQYMKTRPRFNPDVERTLAFEPEGRATMEVRGPEGYLQVYEASLLESEIHLEG